MKKIVLSFVALFCAFSYVAFAQPNAGPAPVIAPEPLLNDMQLEREKWYYSLEEAMADPGKVYKLCLKDKNLTQVPKEVFYFTNLQVLNLSENKIKALPAELGHLKNLQVLNIYDNKVKMLPPEMQELTNITDLYLSQNR
ncbi:MAG: leucine-rich repeat domain-containing protein, partial [Bacteroidia bacterium]